MDSPFIGPANLDRDPKTKMGHRSDCTLSESLRFTEHLRPDGLSWPQARAPELLECSIPARREMPDREISNNDRRLAAPIRLTGLGPCSPSGVQPSPATRDSDAHRLSARIIGEGDMPISAHIEQGSGRRLTCLRESRSDIWHAFDLLRRRPGNSR